jgi:hypothetical protein
VVVLGNNNYVVASPSWDNSATSTANAGAVTFGSGTTGVSGVVSVSNSLVGGRRGDSVGIVTALKTGNYVVASPLWSNGAAEEAGAVTFVSGATGMTGIVSASNSLIGSMANDGFRLSVTALESGNYVATWPAWDNGSRVNAGAVVFGSGTSGAIGVVSPANALIGGHAYASVGGGDDINPGGVTALSNGNYVVASPYWRRSSAGGGVGAVTLGSGASGIVGAVSESNSLVGSTGGDTVGSYVVALEGSNYVVISPNWSNGATSAAGAVTFRSGTSPGGEIVSAANSLVGSQSGDLNSVTVTALDGGGYVVLSRFWDNGPSANAGAATFGSGSQGVAGVISEATSLVGIRPGDVVGAFVTELSNGNYVVGNPNWNDHAGALTFGSGTSGVRGPVSASNSLIGTNANDEVGRYVVPVENGNYITQAFRWDNGATIDAGAIALGLSNGSVVGPISEQNGILGEVPNAAAPQPFAFDAARNQLVVGQPASNRVVFHRPGISTETRIVGDGPDPSQSGQLVTLSAVVAAASAPTNGQVLFAISTGESCIDATPSKISASESAFSCALVLSIGGVSSVVAEYTGSTAHAYSRSTPELHTTISQVLFAHGFEGP